MPKQKPLENHLDQDIESSSSSLNNKRTSKKRKMNIIKSFLKTSKSRLGGSSSRSIIKLPRPSSLTGRKSSSMIKSPKSVKKSMKNNSIPTKSMSQQSSRRLTKLRRKNLKRNHHLRNVKSRDQTHLHLLNESNFRPKTDVVYSSLIFRHIPYNWINDETDDNSIKFIESDSLEDSLISFDNSSPATTVEINEDTLITLESIQTEFDNVYQKDIFNANFKPSVNNKNNFDNDY
ncbi:hypothetical protein BLA29_000694 [Euroglyphus maynei]|uniref:Uncharacterized protein n=1 Tax=Euroglyphus maynei TaxID=6958 RepID=A0A1Y3BJ36_EURMA|nr:hypothetical protein BLA29_000694 [Euroglyphus maynei]